MPPPRRRNYRKRKRTYKRRLKPNYKKKPSNQITSAVFRNWETGIISNLHNGTSGVARAGHLGRALSDMNGCVSYLNMFSQYRVRKIKYQFIPSTGEKAVTDPSKATTQIRPLFTTAINRVSTSFPQDSEQIFTMMSARWTKAGTYHQRYFKPVTFDQVFRDPNTGETNPALNPSYDQWLSTNMPNTAQHGLSYVLGAAGDLPTGYFKYRLVTTMYVEFKNRRVNTDNTTIKTLDSNGNLVDGTVTINSV